MSHLRDLQILASSLLSTLQQSPEGARTVFLRCQTSESRAALRERLPMALALCGCDAPVVTEMETHLTLCFDLPLEQAFAVYGRLIEAGLEMDGESHRELTRLCAIQSHAAETLAAERPCTVGLQVRFREEQRRMRLIAPAARA